MPSLENPILISTKPVHTPPQMSPRPPSGGTPSFSLGTFSLTDTETRLSSLIPDPANRPRTYISSSHRSPITPPKKSPRKELFLRSGLSFRAGQVSLLGISRLPDMLGRGTAYDVIVEKDSLILHRQSQNKKLKVSISKDTTTMIKARSTILLTFKLPQNYNWTKNPLDLPPSRENSFSKMLLAQVTIFRRKDKLDVFDADNPYNICALEDKENLTPEDLLHRFGPKPVFQKEMRSLSKKGKKGGIVIRKDELESQEKAPEPIQKPGSVSNKPQTDTTKSRYFANQPTPPSSFYLTKARNTRTSQNTRTGQNPIQPERKLRARAPNGSLVKSKPVEYEAFDRLDYKFSDGKSMLVTASDYACLFNNLWINDSLIDFFLRYEIETNQDLKVQKNEVHVLTTHFFTKLVGKKNEVGYYEEMKRWLKKARLDRFRYIVMPINENLHWYCAIIKGFSELVKLAQDKEALERFKEAVVQERLTKEKAAQERAQRRQSQKIEQKNEIQQKKRTLRSEQDGLPKEENGESDEEQHQEIEASDSEGTNADEQEKSQQASQLETAASPKSSHPDSPIEEKSDYAEENAEFAEQTGDLPPKVCIYYFDSLAQKHDRILEPIVACLIGYAKDILGIELVPEMFEVRRSTVPKQNNFNDCGVHVIYNVLQFLKKPEECLEVWQRYPARGKTTRVVLSLFVKTERDKFRALLRKKLVILELKQKEKGDLTPKTKPEAEAEDDEIEIVEERDLEKKEESKEDQTEESKEQQIDKQSSKESSAKGSPQQADDSPVEEGLREEDERGGSDSEAKTGKFGDLSQAQQDYGETDSANSPDSLDSSSTLESLEKFEKIDMPPVDQLSLNEQASATVQVQELVSEAGSKSEEALVDSEHEIEDLDAEPTPKKRQRERTSVPITISSRRIFEDSDDDSDKNSWKHRLILVEDDEPDITVVLVGIEGGRVKRRKGV